MFVVGDGGFTDEKCGEACVARDIFTADVICATDNCSLTGNSFLANISFTADLYAPLIR